MGNWSHKTELVSRANSWVRKMDSKERESTQATVLKSVNYADSIDTSITHLDHNHDTRYGVVNETTVDEIIRMGTNIMMRQYKIAALNFASFKHPGGAFLNGANAQEEHLCHYSNLYNILGNFKDSFYEVNKKKLNKGFYTSNLLYLPDVVFIKGTIQVPCDIITCAAPNARVVQRYNMGSDVDIKDTLYDRIDHILYAAADNQVELLILGAFGCGVFKNDAHDVADTFYTLLTNKYKGIFEFVSFAIPNIQSEYNYNAFLERFNGVLNESSQ